MVNNSVSLAPIVLFVYNRMEHTKQTIAALQKNQLADKSELFIYSDAPKDGSSAKSVSQVTQVRDYLDTITSFKKVYIIKREKNWGLAANIIDGVGNTVNTYGQVIVLEDDLVTSPYFLTFMNRGLAIYCDDLNVASIHGYIYPIKNLPETFFIKGADCWGWATWKRAWDFFEPRGEKLLTTLKDQKAEREFNFNNTYPYSRMLKNQIKGRVNSWAIRWYASSFVKNMVTLYPGVSYVYNIGLDGGGTHFTLDKNLFNQPHLNQQEEYKKIPTAEHSLAKEKIEIFFLNRKSNFLKKTFRKIFK